MLEIKNVTKVFKKGFSNKVKAINNTSLKFDENGLVALLGPSGCGKTTLLNTIGGLDKVNKGKIYINNNNISSRFSYKVDRIRNKNIGYIFQDYKLIENMSVYDNVAIVLKMLGIKDKKIIKERVEYVLDKVGMYRYKRRPAGMLSGGEKQRVAIARAIVKNPKILLCDEPTGNLDSRNSLEIMKIIKSISKDRLVLLVTHEQNLAKFYADRVITIADGKVEQDYINDHSEELDYQMDNTIYLKDMKNINNIVSNNCKLNVFSDNEEKININIIIKNNNIYIENKGDEKVEVVDDLSTITIIDDHYKKIAKSEIEKYKFDTTKLDNKNYKLKYSSIKNIFKNCINGFFKVLEYPLMKKFLLIGFFVCASIILISSSIIMATKQIDEKDYIEVNKNYVHIKSKKINLNNFYDINNNEIIDYAIPGNSIIKLELPLDFYYQSINSTENLIGSIAPVSELKKENMLYGKIPSESNEIVIDKLVYDKLEDNSKNILKNVGILNTKELIDLKTKVGLYEYKIVGISNTTNPSIYVMKDQINKIIINNNDFESKFNLKSYNDFKEKINLKEGREPLNDYEIIVNISNKEDMKLNKEINEKINDTKLKVVGYYTSQYSYDSYFANDKTIMCEFLSSQENISLYSNDKDKVMNFYQEKGYNTSIPINDARKDFIKEKKDSTKGIIYTTIVMIVISVIEIIFMIRASFLSRIKEVGIYRAIGVKKIDIYKMFVGEIVAITTLANVPAIIFTSYVISKLSEINLLKNYLYISTPLVIFIIILNYVFNIVIGLMPIHSTIRKRPAEILSRHDIG